MLIKEGDGFDDPTTMPAQQALGAIMWIDNKETQVAIELCSSSHNHAE
jgi:hypothetical protein